MLQVKSDAIVSIRVEQGQRLVQRSQVLDGNAAAEFFARFPATSQAPSQGRVHILGAGFIISSDGYIATDTAARLSVRLLDGRE